MQSPTDTSRSRHVRTVARIALLGAVGAALAVVETMFPRPVPWARLGLGHIAVLFGLWIEGPFAALGVSVVKLFVSGLVGGTLAQPTMMVSSVASFGAWGAMSLTYRARSFTFMGPVGVSLVGSLAYGVCQVWVLATWLVKAPLGFVAPLIMGPTVVAGAVTGVVAAVALYRMGMWKPIS